MSGIALTTSSPSSRKSSRRTPCVEGCCGPIESVICDSRGRSRSSTSLGKFSTAVDIKLKSENIAQFQLEIRQKRRFDCFMNLEPFDSVKTFGGQTVNLYRIE